MLFVGMTAYAVHISMKDRAAFIAATQDAPQEKHLLTYLAALFHDGDKVADQAAQIVCELLGRLSKDQLACIPDQCWIRLCPRVEDTRSGYFNEKELNRNDQVQVAVFSAIMRMKRMESLPYVESWMLKTSRHSLAFVRNLHACHEALLKYQASLQHSSTLLRPSSSEAATTGELLRPVSGTQPSEIGEQLLRGWQREENGFIDRSDAAVSCASFELTLGDRADAQQNRNEDKA